MVLIHRNGALIGLLVLTMWTLDDDNVVVVVVDDDDVSMEDTDRFVFGIDIDTQLEEFEISFGIKTCPMKIPKIKWRNNQKKVL